MYRNLDLGAFPAGDRFAIWYEMLQKTFAPVDIRTDEPRRFRGGFEALDLGLVQVSTVRCSAVRSLRSPRLIRRSDTESFHLNLGLRGRFGLDQNGRSLGFGPGDLVLYDSSRPFRTTSQAGRGTVSVVEVCLPRRLVRLPGRRGAELGATALPVTDAVGSLLVQVITRIARDAERYRPADAARLGDVLVDLITAVLADRLDVAAGSMALRVRAYIERHLTDPDLSPAGVAAAHHISLRTLHRLFEGQDATVAGWIRRRRLEGCRRDLGDPRRHDQPIAAIAAHWGFPDPANFSRAFRAAYGLTPGDYRGQDRPQGGWG